MSSMTKTLIDRGQDSLLTADSVHQGHAQKVGE